MTESAKTIIDVSSAFGGWVSNHVVTLGAVIGSVLPMLVILEWVHWDSAKLAAMQMGVVGIVTAITGTGMMTKKRAGERIEEESERKSSIKAEAKVAQMMDSGVFKAPDGSIP